MASQTIFAPAKLNLFLAITGKRPDGFHDLVSVVTPLRFGDLLAIETNSGGGAFSLTCNDPEVPCDESNLVLRAARAFVLESGWSEGASFRLEKRIPLGAGLGGGSSNGVAALRGLNALAGSPLSAERLTAVAATLGSDCPLFLQDGPVVMRGRGERIEPLADAAAARLRGKRVVVFKPLFAVPTAWAYRQMATAAETEPEGVYLSAAAAEQRLNAWMVAVTASAEALLFNNMERAAFGKFLALPTMLQELRERFGLAPRMTGSGSACFAFLPEQASIDEITETIHQGWGKTAFVVETRLA